MFMNSSIRIKHIQNRDGLGRTILLAESAGKEYNVGYWADGTTVVRTTYNKINEWEQTDAVLLGRSFRSAHPGGIHILMGAGDVRFISENVDDSIWKGLSTYRGGEMISDDSF